MTFHPDAAARPPSSRPDSSEVKSPRSHGLYTSGVLAIAASGTTMLGSLGLYYLLALLGGLDALGAWAGLNASAGFVTVFEAGIGAATVAALAGSRGKPWGRDELRQYAAARHAASWLALAGTAVAIGVSIYWARSVFGLRGLATPTAVMAIVGAVSGPTLVILAVPYQALLAAEGRIAIVYRTQGVSALVRFCVSAVWLVFDRSLLGIGVAHFVASVLFYWGCRRSARALRFEARASFAGRSPVRELLVQSRAPFAAAVGRLIFGPLLRLVVGLTSGATALGLFEAVTRPLVSLGVLLGSAAGPVFPEFAARNADLRGPVPSELDRRVHRGLLALGVSAWGVTALAIAPVLEITGYRDLALPLVVLSVAYMANTLGTASYYRSLAVGPGWAAPASVLLQGGIATIGAAMLSVRGGVGPIILVMAASIALAGVFLGLTVYGLRSLVRAAVFGARSSVPALIVLALALIHQSSTTSAAQLVTNALAGGLVLGSAVWWWGPLSPSQRAHMIAVLSHRARARRFEAS